MTRTTYRDLDSFTQAYVMCAFWTAEPRPSSGDYAEQFEPGQWDDLSEDDQARVISDCESFQTENAKALNIAYNHRSFYPSQRGDWDGESRAGHDFYLSRNGFGAGFQDRGDHFIWDMLAEAARKVGESQLNYWADCERHRETGKCGRDCDHDGEFSLA